MINAISYALGTILGILLVLLLLAFGVVVMTAIGAFMGYIADFLIPDLFIKLFGIPGYQVGAVAGTLSGILNISIGKK